MLPLCEEIETYGMASGGLRLAWLTDGSKTLRIQSTMHRAGQKQGGGGTNCCSQSVLHCDDPKRVMAEVW